jgi:hypothetical protein
MNNSQTRHTTAEYLKLTQPEEAMIRRYTALFFGACWLVLAIGISIALSGCAKSAKAIAQQKEIEEAQRLQILEQLEYDESIPEEDDTGLD